MITKGRFGSHNSTLSVTCLRRSEPDDLVNDHSALARKLRLLVSSPSGGYPGNRTLPWRVEDDTGGGPELPGTDNVRQCVDTGVRARRARRMVAATGGPTARGQGNVRGHWDQSCRNPVDA